MGYGMRIFKELGFILLLFLLLSTLAFSENIESLSNEALSNETLINETLANETLANETLTNETLTNETLTNETLTNETLTNETLTNETLTNETLTNETLTNETLTNETLTNETLTNETLTNETLTNETLTNETLTKETLTNETLTNETLTNETLTNETLTNETLTNETLTNETLTNETLANEALANETLTNETLVNEILSNETLRNEPLSNETDEIIITTISASAQSVDADTDKQDPCILPPDLNPGGKTYGEWSALWWQWAYSMPVDEHPLYDTADCSQRQSGDVWFLGSSFATEQGPSGESIAKVNRKCTVPPGKMLFFPVINVEGSKLEENGETEAQLAEYAKWVMDHATDLSVKIDGKPVEDLQQYRAQSPLFTFGPLPENNVLQSLGINEAIAGTTSPAVADGIYLMLAPLPIGTHTIQFKGTFEFTKDPDEFDFVFKQDVKYKIAVKPQKRLPGMILPHEEA